VSTLILVRGLPYTGKTSWVERQMTLLTNAPLYFFEPVKYYHKQKPERRSWSAARTYCLERVHGACVQDNNAVVFVADIFTTEQDLAPYFRVHAKYRLLIEMQTDTCVDIDDRARVRIETRWDAPEAMQSLQFTSVQDIMDLSQNIQSPYLSFKSTEELALTEPVL